MGVKWKSRRGRMKWNYKYCSKKVAWCSFLDTKLLLNWRQKELECTVHDVHTLRAPLHIPFTPIDPELRSSCGPAWRRGFLRDRWILCRVMYIKLYLLRCPALSHVIWDFAWVLKFWINGESGSAHTGVSTADVLYMQISVPIWWRAHLDLSSSTKPQPRLQQEYL